MYCLLVLCWLEAGWVTACGETCWLAILADPSSALTGRGYPTSRPGCVGLAGWGLSGIRSSEIAPGEFGV